MNNWTDDHLIKAIQGEMRERNAALQYLYQNQSLRSAVFHFVMQRGGDQSDAKRVFQDAMIVLDRHVRSGSFQGKSKLSTFFIGIAHRTWLKADTWESKTTEFQSEHVSEVAQEADDSLIQDEMKSTLYSVLEKIGERCKELLRLNSLHYSMEEVAQLRGFSGTQEANNAIYRCREQLRNFLREHPSISQQLKSYLER